MENLFAVDLKFPQSVALGFNKMYKRESGYRKVIEVNKVPLFIHWSLPVGGLLIAAYFNSDLEKTFYFVAAYVALVLIHEIGHMVMAMLFGVKVFALTLNGAGGACCCEELRSYRQALFFYGGGLVAQLVLFGITGIYLTVFGYPSSSAGNAFMLMFTAINFLMFIINIIPSKTVQGQGNDGYALWVLSKSYYGKA